MTESEWKSRALAAEADLAEFRRLFDGHIYVKDVEYAAFHARLRAAEADRDKYRKLWVDAVVPPPPHTDLCKRSDLADKIDLHIKLKGSQGFHLSDDDLREVVRALRGATSHPRENDD